MKDPRRGPQGNADLDGLVAIFLRDKVARHEFDPMTARNYRSALGAFVRAIDRRLPYSAEDVELWQEARAHLRASTRRREFSMIRHFSKWLVHRGELAADPTDDVLVPRLSRSVPRALSGDVVARIVAVAPGTRGRAIVMLMVGMGLRCVEVERLEVADWDRSTDVLLIHGKFGHERLLPVPAEVRRAVDAYLLEFPASSGPLIRSYRRPGMGLRADTLSGMVSEWMRASGAKSTPRDGVAAHALRHTAASDVLDRCGDLRVVQEMLGHRNLATTSVYLRRAGMKKMREAMEGRGYDGPESAA